MGNVRKTWERTKRPREPYVPRDPVHPVLAAVRAAFRDETSDEHIPHLLLVEVRYGDRPGVPVPTGCQALPATPRSVGVIWEIPGYGNVWTTVAAFLPVPGMPDVVRVESDQGVPPLRIPLVDLLPGLTQETRGQIDDWVAGLMTIERARVQEVADWWLDPYR